MKLSQAQRWLGAIVLAGAAFAAVALLALRRFRLPAPTGPYAVGTTILNFTDGTRNAEGLAAVDAGGPRHLVVQLWYPASASQARYANYARWKETSFATSYEALLRTNSRWDAPLVTSGMPFPLLIFGHRWAGQRTQNTDLAEELASHGYVVAAVDHPYNSSRVLLANGQVVRGNEALEGPKGEAASAAERIAYWNRQLDVWAADDVFVLNQLAAKDADATDAWRGRVDMQRVGAFGHSFGGAVSLRLCGMDTRIRAAVNLDGWSFGALRDRNAEQPALMLYEQVSLDREKELQTLPLPGTLPRESGEDQLDRADFDAVNASLGKYGGEELYVAGTQHLDFSDQPLLPPLRRGSYTGPIAPLRIQAIVRASVLAFFDATLRGDPSPWVENLRQKFPEVTARRTEPVAGKISK